MGEDTIEPARGSALQQLPAAELASLVERVSERVAEGLPELEPQVEGFMAYLDERLPSVLPATGGPLEADDLLASIWVEDLYLAFACASGLPGALEAFEARHGPALRGICERFATVRAGADDLRQLLWEKLFVGSPDRPPAIAEYSGKGFLENWLRVTAVRALIDERRRTQRADREQPMTELPDVAGDLDFELDFLKARYRRAFKVAFEAAVGELTSHERNLLRFQLLAGLTMEQLAALFRIDRSTVVRRLTRARQRLLKATRRQLTDALRLDTGEFDSLMAFIRSRLDLSLQRVLGSRSQASEREE